MKKENLFIRIAIGFVIGIALGFLAPSFGCAIEPYYSAFQNSLQKWKDMGYTFGTLDELTASQSL